METNAMLKDRMTFDEMAAAYKAANPNYKANRITVGRFAKELGYEPRKQMVDRIIERFYLKVR